METLSTLAGTTTAELVTVSFEKRELQMQVIMPPMPPSPAGACQDLCVFASRCEEIAAVLVEICVS